MANFGLILFSGLLFFIGLGLLINHGYLSYTYEKQIGAYFENAYDCITPDCFINNLQKGIIAINNSGLKPEDNGAMFFTKPSTTMSYQYEHLYAILDRAKAIKQWHEQVSKNGTTSVESMKDVYTEKMDNLRNYLRASQSEPRSDWISQDAWMIKFHSFNYLFGAILGVFLLIIGFLLGLVGLDLS